MSETLEGARRSQRRIAQPLLVLKKLDKSFGATHALKAVDLTFEQGEIHAIVGENGAGKSTLDQGSDRRPSAHLGRSVLARRAGAAGQSARGDRPRHQRGASGSRAVPAPDGGRQHLPRRRDHPRRRAQPQGDGARRAEAARRSRLQPAGRRRPVVADHRPAAADRHGAGRAARRQVPHLRRADRLFDPPGSVGAVQADPPAQGQRRDDRLHQPPPGGSVRAVRPRLGAARRRAGGDARGRPRPTRPISSR